MARRTGSGGRRRAAGTATVAVMVLMALSLAVRWAGVAPEAGADPDPFQVEVLNGTGEPGLARSVTKRLRLIGIDVLLEGNAERFDFPESVLIDRRGNPDLIRRLQRRLGVRKVIVQVQPGALVDATIVVGHDCERLRLQP